MTIDLASQKFTVVVEIVLINGINIVVSGAAPKISFCLLNYKHMQIFNSDLVCRGITSDGKHALPILLLVVSDVYSVAFVNI